MTDATRADDLQARVDRLGANRARQGATTATPPHRRPAKGAKIAAAGLSIATMLGLVGAMGYAASATVTGATTTAPPAAPIALTAQPVVRQAPAAQTPIAKTHGSR